MTANLATLAVVQMTSDTDSEANVAVALGLCERAADQGATYVQVPEYVTFYGSARGFGDAAETVPGPTTARFAELARRRGVTVHVGSLLERTPAAGRFHNTSVLIDATGEIVGVYRKAHLFDIDVPGEVAHHESEAIVAGNDVVAVEVGGLHVGMTICFDLRFPELYRRLAREGATVLAIPSAFAAATGRVHWEVLVRARAIENHAYVAAAAQVGTTSDGLTSWGHAMVVGPWGEILAQSRGDEPQLVIATVDLDEVAKRRAQIDVLTLRRPDLYGEAD
ncbi:MAG TPA: carbon-nitrogen hydrolase family protein [Acidimicrobiales bacterium]|nr:carbon-nitrogen hydrolase family protein [Acidimicrobiales bacterium]